MNLDLKSKIDPLINLIKQAKNDKDFYQLTLELEKILKEYLTVNKYDSEIWILFALTIYQAPIHYAPGAVEALLYVLSYDKNNYKAALLLAYIINYSYFIWEEGFFEQLGTIVPPSKEVAALLEYAQYYHYELRDYIKGEYHLLKSIEYDNKQVWNNIKLARIYLYEFNDKLLYKKYFINGFRNIIHVYRDYINDPYFDAYNIDEFINTRLKGIHLSASNYEALREEYNKIMCS